MPRMLYYYWYVGIYADSTYEVMNDQQGVLQLKKSKIYASYHI